MGMVNSLAEGGQGSGNFGHSGRPGKVGGSAKIHNPTPKSFETRGVYDNFIDYKYKNLPEDEKAALAGWGINGLQINSFLRGQGIYSGGHILTGTSGNYQTHVTISEVISGLDKVMQRRKTDKPITLYRATHLGPRASVGETFSDRGFVATTIDRGILAEQFGSYAYTSIITIPAGTNYAFGTKWEKEILLPRNSTFRILSIDHDKHEAKMELVP